MAIEQLLRKFHLPPHTRVELLRRGTNTVYALPEVGRVLRVSDGGDLDAIQQNVYAVAALAQHARVLPPATLCAETAGNAVATLWPLGGPSESGAAELGAALRSLHHVPTTHLCPLPRLDGLRRAWARFPALRSAGVPPRYLDFLRGRLNALTTAHDAMVCSGHAIIHGDAHPGNVVHFNGQTVLVDMDTLCTGPWQYDLVPAVVRAKRMASTTALRQLEAAYGTSVTGWVHLPPVAAATRSGFHSPALAMTMATVASETKTR